MWNCHDHEKTTQCRLTEPGTMPNIQVSARRMKNIDPDTQILFSEAYILGGSPCSGKSTVAEKLSDQFNFQYYKVDDFEKEHSNRCQPDLHPTMFKYSRMGWNEIWSRPVSIQVEEELKYYRERFEMIIEDLDQYDPGKPMILEGAAYLPELLKEYKANPGKVLYMVPTKEFQVHHYHQRPWIKQILKECTSPEHAFENWMMRDYLFGQQVLRQAKIYHFMTLIVDGRLSISDQFEQVRQYFKL